jgi:hypothetical protein
MPDPIITDPIPNPDAAELATLKRVNAELLQTKHTLKARVSTLESEAATLESRAEKAESTLRATIIELPLARLSQEISNAPKLLLEELHRDFDFIAADNGEISLLTKDGKPVTDPSGKPVPLTHIGLYQLCAGKLNESKSEREKVYATLMRYTGASGGAGRKPSSFPSVTTGESEKKDSPQSYGLR